MKCDLSAVYADMCNLVMIYRIFQLKFVLSEFYNLFGYLQHTHGSRSVLVRILCNLKSHAPLVTYFCHHLVMLCSLERPDLVIWILLMTGEEKKHLEVVVRCYRAIYAETVVKA